MATPEVDKKMLRDLESMGFPTARATRALHFSGNSSIEEAINWLVEHENNPDIDQMPLVPITIQIENGTSWMTPDEVRMRLLKLRETARTKREEEEHRSEREREKARIRAGKELLEAKRINEENERKRMLLLRKVEKDEEKRARENIRQRVEEDNAERRRKLGLQPQDPGASPLQENKRSISVKPTAKAEHMRECLRSLKKNNKGDDARVTRAFQTLAIYVRNVAKNPDEEKFRKIRLRNPNFQDRIGRLKGGIEFLELCGFEKLQGGEYLYLPRDKVDMTALNNALSQLHSALENPFFGVLYV
ncbi:UBX domain-containing protein 1-like [Canna indica]|uniref:UBX domain-containing protein 1-like n=1 Tax=Canna indica TaxID=4628 RepID=A0AAQ3Q9L3_9LILI|nr:UBX domain-containing protein 1-like [Canna indica]